jgi:hypothetical protein
VSLYLEHYSEQKIAVKKEWHCDEFVSRCDPIESSPSYFYVGNSSLIYSKQQRRVAAIERVEIEQTLRKDPDIEHGKPR